MPLVAYTHDTENLAFYFALPVSFLSFLAFSFSFVLTVATLLAVFDSLRLTFF